MRGSTLVVAAAVLWGTTGTAQALGPEAATPLGVGSLRLILGGLTLAAVAMTTWRSEDLRWLRRPATLVGAIGMAAYQPAFFTGVDRTGVAVGTMVAIGSGPIFVGVLEALLTRSRPRRSWVIATSAAVAGLVLLGLASGEVDVDRAGIVFALIAGLAYASYAVAAARLAVAGPPQESAGVIFALAAVMLIPVAATQNLGWALTRPGVATVVWLGVAATALAYLLFTTGLRATGASIASTLALAEPVTATILGVLVLSERPGPVAWAGVSLIGLGLVLAARASRAGLASFTSPDAGRVS